MAAVTREIVIDRTPERLFDVIVDYQRYPEFVPGIKACRVAPGAGPTGRSSTSSTSASGASSTCCATSRSGRAGSPGRWSPASS